MSYALSPGGILVPVTAGPEPAAPDAIHVRFTESKTTLDIRSVMPGQTVREIRNDTDRLRFYDFLRGQWADEVEDDER
jgi:hypothetical protein